MPTLHSKLGASGAYRWMNCPGSIALSAQAGEGPTSRYAAEGTAAHALAEWSLVNNKDPQHLIGWWVDGDERIFESHEEADAAGHDFIFEVDEEMVEAVRIYYHYFKGEVEAREFAGEEPALFVEQGFDLSFIRPGMFGTNDASVFCPGRTLIVGDYKHGAGKVVEVKENPQLLYYALGALRELCWEVNDGGWNERLMPDTVKIVVIQPRATHKDGPVREWEVPADYIIHDFADMLKEAADRTATPNAERRASPDWCQFCSAKTICPEFEEMVTTPMALTFDESDLEGLSDLSPADAKSMGREKGALFAKEGPERVADILALAPVISSMIEAAKHQALQMAKSGQEVPGFKVVRGRKHRRWKDPKTLVDTLTIALDEDDLYQRKLKTPAMLEKEGHKDAIDGLWEQPEGALTIAPLRDKRPGIEVFDPEDLIE